MAVETANIVHPPVQRAVIALLAVLNVGLLAALILFHNSLPAAMAQAGGKSGEYVCVTAKPSGQAYDVLFVLDPASHQLHGFYPAPPPAKQMIKSNPRDVRKDFGN